MSGPDHPPTSDPGAAKPGATQPGAPQPGAANPSAANPSAANPSAANPSAANRRPAESAPPSDGAGRDAAGPPQPVRPARHRRGDPLSRVLAGAGVLLVLVAAGFGARAAAGPARDEPAAVHPTDAAAPPPAAAATRNPAAPSWGPVTAPQSPVAPPTARAARTRPVSVSIPSLGVRSSLIPLALLPATGELAAPADFDQAGWYADGPTPGDPGPAVIAGHVDSRRGPAIFFRLRELRVGDVVEVRRTDGVTARFAVTGVERYPKAAFPTQRVHGPTPDRALRLITCGGSFDQAKRSYRDNVVVYAVRTD